MTSLAQKTINKLKTKLAYITKGIFPQSTDTSNSGVYKYDAAAFGTSSDASNDYAIYYYRGVLEPTADQGSYGSDGKATTYPNYVKLGNNTCW